MRLLSTAPPLRLGKGETVDYDEYRHRKGFKVHAAVSRESLPLSVAVGPGDEHDGRCFKEVLEGLRVEHGVGRPRKRPGAYTRTQHTIPSM